MTNPWFRLYNEIIDDKKIRLLSFEDRWHYVALLCLKNSGDLDRKKTLLDQIVSVGLGVHGTDLASVKKRLMEVSLIDSNWQPLAWDRRQFKSDGSTERVRRHRKNKDVETRNGDETLHARSRNAPEAETEPEQNRILRESPQPSANGPPPCPHQEIIDVYHECLPELPRVRVWTDKRKRSLQARWREDPKRQSTEWWRKFFTYIHEKQPFVLGHNERGWVADLEWICTEGNFAKIIEGARYRSKEHA